MTVFDGVFRSTGMDMITVGKFLLCMGVALALGLYLAIIFTIKSRYSQSFILTMAILPAVVCVVIMMVNGSIGAGVAVAGTFSLVRFRSAPGTGKEISGIFLAMASGLICGMGYLGFAALFALIMGGVLLLYAKLGVGLLRKEDAKQSLQITIPEDLDYTGVFDDLFEKYTDSCKLDSVKTTNMGSLYKLSYEVSLKKEVNQKQFLDEIRCRNGNLDISLHKTENVVMEL